MGKSAQMLKWIPAFAGMTCFIGHAFEKQKKNSPQRAQRYAKFFNRVMTGRDPAIYGRCPDQVWA
jgi:hypothetical protein